MLYKSVPVEEEGRKVGGRETKRKLCTRTLSSFFLFFCNAVVGLWHYQQFHDDAPWEYFSLCLHKRSLRLGVTTHSSHPGRKIEFSSIFRQHSPFNIRTVQLRNTPAKIITTAYYFLRHWTVWAVNYDKIWFTSLHLWLHYFVLTVPLGLSLSQPHVEGCCIFAACNTQLRIPYKLLTGICGPALAQADSHPDSKMMHTVFEATTLHTQDRQY